MISLSAAETVTGRAKNITIRAVVRIHNVFFTHILLSHHFYVSKSKPISFFVFPHCLRRLSMWDVGILYHIREKLAMKIHRQIHSAMIVAFRRLKFFFKRFFHFSWQNTTSVVQRYGVCSRKVFAAAAGFYNLLP